MPHSASRRPGAIVLSGPIDTGEQDEHQTNNVLRGFALAIVKTSPGFAADHLDTPLVRNDPAADINDVYTFVNPNDSDELILVMTVSPIAKSIGISNPLSPLVIGG